MLTKDQHYSHSIGVVGNKPGEFLGPSDLTLDSLGNVIIADTRNHRIQVCVCVTVRYMLLTDHVLNIFKYLLPYSE